MATYLISFGWLTPASAAAVRDANFAIAKFRDAYGSPLEAITDSILLFILSRQAFRRFDHNPFPGIACIINRKLRFTTQS